jgi:hypothetical protein
LPERTGQQRKPLAQLGSFAAKDEDMRDFRDAVNFMAHGIRKGGEAPRPRLGDCIGSGIA